MKFDPSVIESFARDLYRRASKIVIQYGLLFALLSLPCSALIYYFVAASVAHEFGTYIYVATGVLFMLVGIAVGSEKAFSLRLQAQTALCQVQIERNTRIAAELASASAKVQMLSLEATHLAPAARAAEVG